MNRYALVCAVGALTLVSNTVSAQAPETPGRYDHSMTQPNALGQQEFILRRMAPFTASQSAPTTVSEGSVGGLQDGAQFILDQQCVDGGWGWPIDSCSPTFHNITAPIAAGLISAWQQTGSMPYLDGAIEAGAFDLLYAYPNLESRFGASAPIFLWTLSAASGDPTYSDFVATDFFDELDGSTYGPSDLNTAGWIAAVEAARTGTWVNLRPWEFHDIIHVATAIGNPGQDALFLQGVLDGLNTLDNTSPASVYSDIIGLAGAIRGLALSGTTSFPAISAPLHGLIDGSTTLCELVTVLKDLQNPDGSWHWHSDLAPLGGATEGDKDSQTTAYALLALIQVDALGTCGSCQDEIAAARSWLAGMQDVDGGYFTYPGSGAKNIEVQGEVVQGLADSSLGSLVLSTPDCPDDADLVEPGTQIAIELSMLNLAGPATGFQAFLTYDNATLSYRGDLSTYTNAPFALHVQDLLSAEVTPGALRLDGSDNFGGGGTAADSLLATLIFDVNVECTMTAVLFDLTQPFDSELSFEGEALSTNLFNTIDFTLDDTAPDITCPADILVPSDADLGCGGAVVNYATPVATDNCGSVDVVCVPPSGSVFPIGVTVVTCTATDACGNETSCTFNVEVTATNEIYVDLELIGVYAPVSRCIQFETDCGSVTHVSGLSFIDHDANNGTAVRFQGVIEIACGDFTQICAKDEQHSLFVTSTVSLAGVQYIADSVLVLEPGDNDNDGDVDINDITFLIFTFGDPYMPGGCPWDGTRDSDFNLDNNVDSIDYSLMITNWLEYTECLCTTLAGPVDASPFAPIQTSIKSEDVHPLIADAADLNRDGVINFLDVRIFETRHGLGIELSSAIEATEQRMKRRK